MEEQKQEIMIRVGKRIRELRRTHALSQEEAALRAGLNPAYFGQVERGEKCPTIDTLNKIAGALGKCPADLLRADSPPEDMDAFSQRVTELLAQVPADRREQMLRILEDITDLF